jgi:ferredoxin-NADP reductase
VSGAGAGAGAGGAGVAGRPEPTADRPEVADPVAWRPGTVVSTTRLSATGRSVVVAVPGLRPARAGQHVDLRLTADDGYQAVRSYSLSDVRGTHGDVGAGVGAGAGAGAAVAELEISVEQLADGEVSPYLVEAAEPGDPVEVRGPIGGWFVWPPTEFDPDSAVHAVLPEPEGAPAPGRSPVQLIGGGSGVAPLVAMIRSRSERDDSPPMRLICSVRTPGDRWFADELDDLVAAAGPDLTVDWVFTRAAPEGADRPAGRLTRERLLELALPAERHPLVYVCGTNAFVETIAGWLVDAGHDPTRVRTERFGGA